MLESKVSSVKLELKFKNELTEELITKCMKSYKEILRFNVTQIFDKKRKRVVTIFGNRLERSKI